MTTPTIFIEHWADQARCRHTNPDALFVRGAAQKGAARICDSCPVIQECRADALDNRIEYGVWGGLTERQRRLLLRRYPNISSWAEFFARGGKISEALSATDT
ncbi:WhiB family transcriptional regulator [Corynebacterium poyangense]|uniref:Transcriptional regulator WhiB n=1 Tax=Corynebacterium poyangense TaxID=2684405 RepID=A0A7H0SLL8_9CORY|nr:WhiB family transcriptional regulator [Corynebacterium poyangense]MBZ8177542.1 WhiB family transcriptional regulator [Corynebacterium poyangense]QNQ89443.1 WhiB family transcriptional regulator [Corynebacterium poyangense]